MPKKNKTTDNPEYTVLATSDSPNAAKTLTAVGTKGRLTPGQYRVMRSDGKWWFCPVELSSEAIIDVGGVGAELLSSIQNFLSRREAFLEMGFPHKRGFLLHGPPGCGKSCALRLVSRHITEQLDGYVLDFDNPTIYHTLRELEPNRPIVMMAEDIDEDIRHYEELILEFLDGAMELENFVFIATTNNLDSIPDRIKSRPSRVDQVIEVPVPNKKERALYLESEGISKKMEDKKLMKQILDASDGLSFAQLKECVISTVLLGNDLGPTVKKLKGITNQSNVGF